MSGVLLSRIIRENNKYPISTSYINNDKIITDK